MSLYVNVTGQGADLVLLHGWAMHGGIFDGVINELAAHYRVHCVDLPGHGRSSEAAFSTQLDELASVVAPSIPDNAIVLGWSLGGLLALHLAQQLSLRALILVSSSPRFVANSEWPHGMAPDVFTQFFTRLQQNMQNTVQDFLRLQVRGDAHAAETFATLKVSLSQYPADPQTLQNGLALLRDTDESAAVSNIHIPVLVIAGEYDRITHPETCAQLARQLPNAQHVLIKRAGHAPFISHRDEFMIEVRHYLSSVVGEGATHG